MVQIHGGFLMSGGIAGDAQKLSLGILLPMIPRKGVWAVVRYYTIVWYVIILW